MSRPDVYRVGDVVETPWGAAAIKALEITPEGEKYGIPVDEASATGFGVADLDNKHWAHLEQLGETVVPATDHPMLRALKLAKSSIYACDAGEALASEDAYEIRWKPERPGARQVEILGPRLNEAQVAEAIAELVKGGYRPLEVRQWRYETSVHLLIEVPA